MFGRKLSDLEQEALDLEEELRYEDDPEIRKEILGELREVYDLIGKKFPKKDRVSPDTIAKGAIILGSMALGMYVETHGQVIQKMFRPESTNSFIKL